MKLLRILFLFAIVLFVSSQGYSKSAADKSYLLNYITNATVVITNWAGTNYGWEVNERLIDNNWVLTYPFGSTNSISNVSSFLLTPITNNNICEPGNDSKYTPDSVSDGEVRSIWMTWDTNGVYFAVQCNAKGGANNILMILDRITAVGTIEMKKMNLGWNRNVNLQGWETDFYTGFWCPGGAGNLTGYEVWRFKDQSPNAGIGTIWDRVGHVEIGGTATWDIPGISNDVFLMFNRDTTEPILQNRVLLAFIHWQALTNGLVPSQISNLTIKLAVVSTGPGAGGSENVYDFCPDNLGGVDVNNPLTFSENYFQVSLFSNKQVLLNSYPYINAKIFAIPGTKPVSRIVPTVFASFIDNFGHNTSYLVPEQGGTLTVTIDEIANIGYIGAAKVTIFDLWGRKIKTLYDDYAPLTDTIINTYLTWDGKDDNGDIVGMGTYLLILTGMNPSGDAIKLKAYINIIR